MFLKSQPEISTFSIKLFPLNKLLIDTTLDTSQVVRPVTFFAGIDKKPYKLVVCDKSILVTITSSKEQLLPDMCQPKHKPALYVSTGNLVLDKSNVFNAVQPLSAPPVLLSTLKSQFERFNVFKDEQFITNVLIFVTLLVFQEDRSRSSIEEQ